MAAPLVLAAAKASGAQIVPIDSEHNAIFQCLPDRAVDGREAPGVRRLILTASGGPFLDWPEERLREATPEQACAHPNWVMGRKISVDSATLMNKGLELIEACALFGLPPERIDILVHPQSVIHSMVEYVDGSVLAQLGSPDMRTPIAQALAWPQRMHGGVQSLDFVQLGRLDFRPPDPRRFPCLRLAPAAIRAGGLTPAILNAANEVAVQAFLDGRLNFLDIPAVIETVMDSISGAAATDLEAVLAADAAARVRAESVVDARIALRGIEA
jgi:1-deoxy-D-xylulose-5-phosphate reductoisomerase